METKKTYKKKPIYRGLIIYYSNSGGSVAIDRLEQKETKGFNYVCTSGEPLPMETEEEIVTWALGKFMSKRIKLARQGKI